MLLRWREHGICWCGGCGVNKALNMTVKISNNNTYVGITMTEVLLVRTIGTRDIFHFHVLYLFPSVRRVFEAFRVIAITKTRTRTQMQTSPVRRVASSR